MKVYFQLLLELEDKMISEREKQRMQHTTPEAIHLQIYHTYTIGSTPVHVVNDNKGSMFGGLVERNGIYFQMTGPELEAWQQFEHAVWHCQNY